MGGRGSEEDAVRYVKDAAFNSRGGAGGGARGRSAQKWVVLFFWMATFCPLVIHLRTIEGAEVSALLLERLFFGGKSDE